MTLIYLIVNLIITLASFQYYQRKLNPVSLYSLVWVTAVVCYKSGMIKYHETMLYTWFVIIFMQTLYTISCFMVGKVRKKQQFAPVDTEILRAKLLRVTSIMLIISGASILLSVYAAINAYGTNLLSVITDIYSNRVDEGESLQQIPYVGSLLYVGVIMCGYYTKRFGFTYWAIIAFLFSALSSLTSGGRAGMVFTMLQFF